MSRFAFVLVMWLGSLDPAQAAVLLAEATR